MTYDTSMVCIWNESKLINNRYQLYQFVDWHHRDRQLMNNRLSAHVFSIRITSTIRRQYKLCFREKLDDVEKSFALSFICKQCLAMMCKYEKNRIFKISFNRPMVGFETTNHSHDCFCCLREGKISKKIEIWWNGNKAIFWWRIFTWNSFFLWWWKH